MRTQNDGNGARLIPTTIARLARQHLRVPRQLAREALHPAPRSLRAITVRGRIEPRWIGRERLACVIDTQPSVPVQRRRNLALLVDALEAAEVPYFLVPGFSNRRYRVGVLDRYRLEVCRALAARYRGAPVYVARMNSAGTEAYGHLLAGDLPLEGLGEPVTRMDEEAADAQSVATPLEGGDDGTAPDPADDSLPEDATAWPWWRVLEIVQTPDGTLTLGLQYGVDLEFWTEDRLGEWVAPRRNAITPTLPAESRKPATLQVAERAYPTFEPFMAPTVDSITFPVDIVYTWVDGSDPEWRADKRAALAAIDPSAMSRLADDEARFVSRDELRYSLRSIEQYAEWARHIWIVTAGQVPSWLNTGSDKVTVVHHKDIWHPEGTLPTFNSQAIGANLHRIPGLAEHYVYFNDDVFLGRPVTAEAFFHPNGLSKFFYSRSQLGLGEPDPAERAPVSAGRVNRALIEEKFGRTVTQRFFHTPQALRRSVLEEMEQQWPDQFRETSRSTFRRVTDITASSSLHHYYSYCTGRATRGTISYGYVSLDRPDLEEALDTLLRRRNKDTFCLNDLYLGDDPDRVDRLVADFLERYFPAPSQFEKH